MLNERQTQIARLEAQATVDDLYQTWLKEHQGKRATPPQAQLQAPQQATPSPSQAAPLPGNTLPSPSPAQSASPSPSSGGY